MLNHHDPIPHDLINTSKAAKIAGCHMATLYRWVLSGRLRAWKLVGRLRVSEAELRALLVPRVRPPAPPAPAQARHPGEEETRRKLRELGFKHLYE